MKKNYLFLLLFAWIFTGGIYAADLIRITSPAYCSDIQGNTTIQIAAPTYTTVELRCWQQGTGQGTFARLGTVTLDEKGAGSIVFPADEFPRGPLTIRLRGTNKANYTDNCYLQLYNKGGISWNEGLPADPPAAAGMQLVFADDFNGTLSIGPDPSIHTYYDHKPPHGSQDFSSLPFRDFNSIRNPFKQMDTYLRIRANENNQSSGIISSYFSNNTGFDASIPSYFECRFIGPNAPGSWPAFWLLSKKTNIGDNNEPCDELDIIEAYGNLPDHEKYLYRIAVHPWGQTGEHVDMAKIFYNSTGIINMSKFDILSSWFETPHIYGCKITETNTIYYCDNKEVARHPTMPISKVRPMYFLINMGTGAHPVDLSRYGGLADMYVDYVRVYSGEKSSTPSIEQPDVNVDVYPNPVDESLTVSLNVNNPADVVVGIYNTLGQQISSYREYQQGEIKIPVDTSNMSNGIYLAKINIGDIQVNKKIIKQ